MLFLSSPHRIRSGLPVHAVIAALIVMVLLLFVPRSAAQAAGGQGSQGPGEAQGRPAHLDPQALLSAVVRVKMRAVADARSNSALGRERDGSGVIIDGDGHILTIGYIVSEADSIEITTQDGKTLPAVLVGYDEASGFGLLHAVAPLAGRPMPLGDSAGLALHDPVMILPAGGSDAASVAYVMSKRAFAGGWEYLLDTAIFTAPPSLNWSGAALVDRAGRLVGIGSLLVRDSEEPGTPMPGNMFVPINLIKPILADFIRTGRRPGPHQPWLGLSTAELQGRLFVTRVSPEGPADRAGIHNGDIVIGVGGAVVSSMEEFYRKVWAVGPAGTDIPLKVLQGPEIKEIRIHSIDRVEYFKEKPST
jgi:S1-C subfamily serine protease